jgi:hypothetical protein
LIGLSAGTVFFREAATAGTNVSMAFGTENHFRLKCAFTERKGNVHEGLYAPANMRLYKEHISIHNTIRSDFNAED